MRFRISYKFYFITFMEYRNLLILFIEYFSRLIEKPFTFPKGLFFANKHFQLTSD